MYFFDSSPNKNVFSLDALETYIDVISSVCEFLLELNCVFQSNKLCTLNDNKKVKSLRVPVKMTETLILEQLILLPLLNIFQILAFYEISCPRTGASSPCMLHRQTVTVVEFYDRIIQKFRGHNRLSDP